MCHPRGCLRGWLLEDHSGNFRIEARRPDRVFVSPRPDEVRHGEVRPVEARPSEARPSEVRPGEVRPGEVHPGEVRLGEVRPHP